MNKMEGIVFDISRYCLDDGPGIRTTVFLKGCPLHCIWCHNPESNSKEIEIGYDASKCVNCKVCSRVCTNHCHEFIGNEHHFNRHLCIKCGRCIEACEMQALSQIGKKMNVDEVMKIVCRDQAFYKSSQGGMTLSGGEIMFQFDFALSLLKEAKKRNIHTCVETTGFVDSQKLLKMIPYVDLFLYDCKQMDSSLHKKYTGVGNELIIKNLKEIDNQGKEVILRLPLIPNINDNENHFKQVGQLANELENILYLEVLPYHPLGLSKAQLIDHEMIYKEKNIPDTKKVDDWVNEIQKYTTKKVIRSKL